MNQADEPRAALAAVVERRSIRRFLPTAVPTSSVRAILQAASRAPSGQNMQPWKVHVVTGETRRRLCGAVVAAAERGDRSDEYPYFPHEIREPYLSRRRKIGYDLFAIYGVARDDRPGRQRAMLRNFDFFGAPTGLFFTMERDWGLGAWLDLGMFMMNVMTLAPAFGLATCPQQAWCEFGDVVRDVLPIAPGHLIVSGMALGYSDEDATENTLRTEREPPEAFTSWHD